jgi:hypothetical protein
MRAETKRMGDRMSAAPKKVRNIELALAWLNDAATEEGEFDERAKKTLRQLVCAAEDFSKLWVKWSVTRLLMPDEDTLDAAFELANQLGIKQPKE